MRRCIVLALSICVLALSTLSGPALASPQMAGSDDPTFLPALMAPGAAQQTTIAVGWSFTCALTTSGAVKCWGDNYYGQLGDGTGANSLTPVSVSGLSGGAKAISAEYEHTCVVMKNGEVRCWGENGSGQLGDGSYDNDRTAPVDVTGLSGAVTAVNVGGKHSCALTSAGGVMCWGGNDNGQLGDGSMTMRLEPVSVTGLSRGVKAITSGYLHSCALTSSGGVKCWGQNRYGQLGNGTVVTSQTPVNVVGLSSGVQAISAGGEHTCALTSAGGVKCWGQNTNGMLGDGTTTSRSTPVDVVGLTGGVKAISAGFTHTCALTNAGGVKCWGLNDPGQLGDGKGAISAESHVPVDVVGLSSGVKSIGLGGYHTCSVLTDDGLKCWGTNYFGMLGDGTRTNRTIPVDVIDW